MRQRRLFLLLIALALLLSGLGWGAAALRRRQLDARPRAAVTWGVLEDAAVLRGVVLRSETVLTADQPYVRILGAEGERLAAGAPLAIVYGSGPDYFRSVLLLRLRAERELSGSAVAGGLSAYAQALARRDFAALPLAARQAGAAMGLAGSGGEDLDAEIAALSPLGEAGILRAYRAGVFSQSLDGWETVSPWMLTPAGLQARLDRADAPARGVGRLVTDSEWFFCALLSPADAARFVPGEALRLRLGDGTDCAAAVGSVLTEGTGALVTLRCREHPEAVLDLRRGELTAVFARYEGYLLPAEAVQTREDGSFVRRADVPLAGKTPVTVLFVRDGRAAVLSEGLREGMQVMTGP